MTGLNNVGQFGATNDADIDAPEAWDTTRGSPSVVVGVVDSGIDATHPDLYLNIWLNQGEIPAAKRSALTDTDSDGLFTFYDLNNAVNAAQVRDLNTNGYIDAIDLLDDPLWADGRDTDGNGFTDDFFGWNFRTDSNETFAPNNPSDVLGHGTHVAGTIGAIGNNARGVTGINWRSSIMALKFLDENNQGDTASAIAAVNYATMMRTQFNTNVRVLNNSWGHPGGSNIALKNTIEASGNAGILFVAAAGNGNILGQGVDNDRTSFYPASYEMENVIAVGASDGTDRLAGFSNYGLRGVDIVAPGVGVRSTLPGGRYGEANGTSMATPHVSGSAALVWSLQPDATVSEIRRALLEQGDLIPAVGSQIKSAQVDG
jgi:subtilisin family serine protease